MPLRGRQDLGLQANRQQQGGRDNHDGFIAG